MSSKILCAAQVCNATPPQGGERALLIFADARSLDLQRRRLAGSFGALFRSLPSAASLAPDADCHLFTTPDLVSRLEPCGGSPSFPRTLRVHSQTGSTFAEKLEAAVETIASLGYREVVIIGSDCPELDAADVSTAFDELARHTLVLGPDRRGGCYLIALRLEARASLHGVSWQRDTDCQQLANRFDPAHVFLLPGKLDLDTLADIRLLARDSGRPAALAWTLLRALDGARRHLAAPAVHFVLALHRLRVRWQLPPPYAGLS